YALAALGLVLIFKTTGVVNFAHGEMATISAYVSYTLISVYGISYFPAVLLSLLFAAGFGLFVYAVLMRRVANETHLNQIVLTIGLFLSFHGITGITWGHRPESFPEAVSGRPMDIVGIYVSPNELFVVAVTACLAAALFFLFRYTRIGL